MAGLVLGLCFLTLELFAPRAAFIHVGAVLGSIMVGNVFFGIIPAQKAFVAAVQAGNEPDLDRAKKPSSVHSSITTSRYQYCSAWLACIFR